MKEEVIDLTISPAKEIKKEIKEVYKVFNIFSDMICIAHSVFDYIR